MFCEKCGKENPNGAKFCEGCGSAMEAAEAAPVTEAAEVVEPATAPSPVEAALGGLKKEYLLPIVGAAAVVVVVVLLAIFGVFKSGPVRVVENYLTGATKYNATKVYNASGACPYLEDEDMDKEERKEMLEEAQEAADDQKQEDKDEGTKHSFKKVRKAKSYKKSEVNEIEERLEENYGYDVEEYPLQGVARVKATVITKEDGDKDSDTQEFITFKVKGKWYVMPGFSKSTIDNMLD